MRFPQILNIIGNLTKNMALFSKKPSEFIVRIYHKFARLTQQSQKHKHSTILQRLSRYKKWYFLSPVFVLIIYVLFLFISFNPQGDPFNKRYSQATYDKNGKILSIFLNNDEQWHLKNTQGLSQKLKIAITHFEDKHFYSHFGFDLGAMVRSFYHNLTSKKRTGASTITMQTIKLLRQDSRTYFNKFREIIFAMKLEWLYSKDEILNFYANNAPYGGNIVGIKTASLMYFNKHLDDLSWSEVALLAVLPNAPGFIHLQKNTNQLLEKRNNLLKKLHKKGFIDEANLKLALSENLPTIQRPKNIAPHLSIRLANANKSLPNISTTIDKNIQIKLESTLKNHHQKLLSLGIQNVAAIIVETQSREVIAYGGSQDFFDIEGFGQIDGITAKRSVGSVLKPLLYALAIDNGLITPESKLIDAPTLWGNFKPKNASKKHYGFISAKTSLIRSLNVPFVALLQDYGYEKFFYDLQNILGFSEDNFEQYGLSLILGTKEFSIEDIAKIYVGLGNYGIFGNLTYMKNTPSPQHYRQIISKGATFLTLDTMSLLDRFGIENYYKNQKIFSWKSGTSYGRKDAWAAGTSPKYTIIVWAGNFDGSANPNLFGVNIAGDLLFSILGNFADLEIFEMPETELKRIKIDELTGYSWDYDDVSFKETLYPINALPLRKSPFLKRIFIDKDGNEADSNKGDFLNAKAKSVLNLPMNLLDFYGMQDVKKSRNLKILYPKNNIKIKLTKDFEGNNALIARIANLNNIDVFWYLNKEFIAYGTQKVRTLELDSGHYTLTVIDKNGQSDSVSFIIE